MKACLYARFSGGLPVTAQKKILRRNAEQDGLIIVREFSDKASSNSRPRKRAPRIGGRK